MVAIIDQVGYEVEQPVIPSCPKHCFWFFCMGRRKDGSGRENSMYPFCEGY